MTWPCLSLLLDVTSVRALGYTQNLPPGQARQAPAWFAPGGGQLTTADWFDVGLQTIGMYLDGRGIRHRDALGRPVIDVSYLVWVHAGPAPVEVQLPGSPWADGYELLVSTDDHGSYRDDLRSFLAQSFEIGRIDGVRELLAALMGQAQVDPEFGATFRERFLKRRRLALGVILERAVDRGDFPDGLRPETVADVVFGVIWYRVLASGGMPDDRLVDELTTMLSYAQPPLKRVAKRHRGSGRGCPRARSSADRRADRGDGLFESSVAIDPDGAWAARAQAGQRLDQAQGIRRADQPAVDAMLRARRRLGTPVQPVR